MCWVVFWTLVAFLTTIVTACAMLHELLTAFWMEHGAFRYPVVTCVATNTVRAGTYLQLVTDGTLVRWFVVFWRWRVIVNDSIIL